MKLLESSGNSGRLIYRISVKYVHIPLESNGRGDNPEKASFKTIAGNTPHIEIFLILCIQFV